MTTKVRQSALLCGTMLCGTLFFSSNPAAPDRALALGADVSGATRLPAAQAQQPEAPMVILAQAPPADPNADPRRPGQPKQKQGQPPAGQPQPKGPPPGPPPGQPPQNLQRQQQGQPQPPPPPPPPQQNIQRPPPVQAQPGGQPPGGQPPGGAGQQNPQLRRQQIGPGQGQPGPGQSGQGQPQTGQPNQQFRRLPGGQPPQGQPPVGGQPQTGQPNQQFQRLPGGQPPQGQPPVGGQPQIGQPNQQFQRPPGGQPGQAPVVSQPLTGQQPFQRIPPGPQQAGPGQPQINLQLGGRVDDLRGQRRERFEGGRTFIEEPDRRMIVRDNGRIFIRHDENERLRLFAPDARFERRGAENFGFYRRPDGFEIITVTDADGRLLRRIRRGPDGREFILIDNRPPVGVGLGFGGFLLDLPPPIITIPRERYIVDAGFAPEPLLFETLEAPPLVAIERPYSLDEIRFNAPLRDRMRRIDINTITFETGSWEVTYDQVGHLQAIANAIRDAIARNPNEVFMIEGHTDAVGNDVDNLSLSDRRASAVANILTESYQIPPENLVTQGYGEQYLKIPTPGPSRENRRVAVRRITPLLTGANR
jgi:outer membrane protein OmpA-like peptidoglycan-associated protein